MSLINLLKIILKRMKIFLKIAFGQEDDFTADCLLDYPYFKENSKLTVSIQKINFTGDLDRAGNMFFILEEVKEIISNFLHETVSIVNLFYFDVND